VRNAYACASGVRLEVATHVAPFIMFGSKRSMLVESDEADGALGSIDGTWMGRAKYALRLWAKRSLLAFWRVGCVGLEIRGLTVYVQDVSDESVKQSTANLKTAVALLDKYDPVRFRRICRDLRNGILVIPTPGTARAEYHRDVDVCFLKADFVRTGHPGPIALSIVHEATHARMRRLSHADPARRARMERRCIAAEIAFASRVPGVSATVDELQARRSRVSVSDSRRCRPRSTAV
jgi:hypothetical protein